MTRSKVAQTSLRKPLQIHFEQKETKEKKIKNKENLQFNGWL
jgi:hypothetical protein